jgi:NitT/TauT family transport system substrate-binding protein
MPTRTPTSWLRRKGRYLAVLSAMAITTAAYSSTASADSSSSIGSLTTITFALDYIANNAGYDGIYVAQKLGYFKQAGLKVKILPYANTNSDVLVAAGKADYGTFDEPDQIIDDASGESLLSIMTIMQHEASRLAVRSDLHLTSPAQLSGKTFGAFGVPMEAVFNNATIADAGGKATYKTVTLSTDVYDALRSGQVDWAIPYATDDILWAQLAGHPFTVFNPQDYGVPDDYGKEVITTKQYAAAHPATTRALVGALVKGYEWAAKRPVQATIILKQSGVGSMDMTDQEGTAKDLAKNYWLDSKGVVGPETAAMWQKFADFLTKYHALKNSSGKVLTTPPHTSSYFTDQYLAKQSN